MVMFSQIKNCLITLLFRLTKRILNIKLSSGENFVDFHAVSGECYREMAFYTYKIKKKIAMGRMQSTLRDESNKFLLFCNFNISLPFFSNTYR